MAHRGDTSEDAESRRFADLRAMSADRRLWLAAEITSEVAMLARAGIQARHPALSDAEVDEELTRLLLGTELAARWTKRRA